MVLFLVIVAVAAGVAFLVLKSKKVANPIAEVQKFEEKIEEVKPKAVKKAVAKKSVKKEK